MMMKIIMKTATTATTILAIFLLVSSSIVTAQAPVPEKEKIDIHELRIVGNPGIDGKQPVGKILTLKPFIGYAYFEADPDMLKVKGTIDVELWAGVEQGEECSTGVLLESTDECKITVDSFSYSGYNTEFSDYGGGDTTIDSPSFPSTSNGGIGAAEFTISDFKLPSGDKQIYFQDRGDKDGKVEICVRMAIKPAAAGAADYYYYDGSDATTKYVSYVDTMFDVDIDLIANFKSFNEQKVQIYSNQPKSFDTFVSATIDVTTYICSNDNTSRVVGAPIFGPGQKFSICVGPSSSDDDNKLYSVENFKTLTCSNSGETRNIITNFIPDKFTTVDTNADENGVRAVRSVVTSGFTDLGDTKFTCEGEVSLEYNNNEIGIRRRRRLITKQFRTNNYSSFSSSPSLRKLNQQQQEQEEEQQESVSQFATVVNIDSNYSLEDSAAATGTNTATATLQRIIVNGFLGIIISYAVVLGSM